LQMLFAENVGDSLALAVGNPETPIAWSATAGVALAVRVRHLSPFTQTHGR
jgi:hypothetical protein